ncbi:hypothetical protein HHI36_003906 [Cryptolaemus montrouzieri]|uniref:Uncharacterized protein n=1 Tax=Cryptolaemus montrouzieri TaxID=559131 RepID=A0ABD2NPZ4_9CUCU
MCNIITDGLITSTRKVSGRRRIQNSKLSLPTLALIERRRNTNRESQEYKELNKIIKEAIRRFRNRQTQRMVQAIEDNMNSKTLRKNFKEKLEYTGWRTPTIMKNRINMLQDFYKEVYSKSFCPITWGIAH